MRCELLDPPGRALRGGQVDPDSGAASTLCITGGCSRAVRRGAWQRVSGSLWRIATWHSWLFGHRRESRVDSGVDSEASARKQPRRVAHLAAGPRLRLAVEVRRDARRGRQGGPAGHALGADQVAHDGVGVASVGRQGQAGNGAGVLLELARLAGVDRPVPGVVGARRDLVPEQRAVAEGGRTRPPARRRGPAPWRRAAAWRRAASRRRGRHAGGREGEVEDVVGVAVLRRRRRSARAPSAPRAAMAETSAAKGTKASSDEGVRGEALEGGLRSAAVRRTAWPRPS